MSFKDIGFTERRHSVRQSYFTTHRGLQWMDIEIRFCLSKFSTKNFKSYAALEMYKCFTVFLHHKAVHINSVET